MARLFLELGGLIMLGNFLTCDLLGQMLPNLDDATGIHPKILDEFYANKSPFSYNFLFYTHNHGIGVSPSIPASFGSPTIMTFYMIFVKPQICQVSCIQSGVII